MNTACDFCKIETFDLGFDDVHGSMGVTCPGTSMLYGFMCGNCRAINDAFWNLSGIATRVEMEIQMIQRAFRRARNEIFSVQD